MRANLKGDRPLLLITAVLVGMGLLMIYSSSSIIAYKRFGDSLHFFKRQLVLAVLGSMGLMLFAGISLGLLRRLGNWFGLVSLALLVAVLLPGVGIKMHSAQRWIGLGGVAFQPAEFAKFALVIFLAGSLASRVSSIRDLKRGMLPYYGLMVVVFLLLYCQPDFGTAVMMCLVIYMMLFLAGGRLLHLMIPLVLAPPVLYLCVRGEAYRWKRILAFLDPFADAQGGGFQIIQSFIALGTGGINGVGLGDSAQKLFYLPEPHTDFIFAIIGEEFGLVGTLGFILLFVFLLRRCVLIARRAPDLYTFLLASGLTVMLLGQVMMNLGVVTGLLPTKGMTLPFLSYGGSSLIFSLCAIGLLTNISKVAEETRYS